MFAARPRAAPAREENARAVFTDMSALRVLAGDEIGYVRALQTNPAAADDEAEDLRLVVGGGVSIGIGAGATARASTAVAVVFVPFDRLNGLTRVRCARIARQTKHLEFALWVLANVLLQGPDHCANPNF